MITGELRGKVDRVWDAFWMGGISNPVEVIEQITFLLFLQMLDEKQDLMDSRLSTFPDVELDPIFPEGNTPTGVPYTHLRWKYIQHQDPTTAFDLVANHVFPFLRTMGREGSTHAGHMEGARLTIPTPGLLVKVIDMLTDMPMNRRDTSGDLYEYMLSKLASAGQNGQFRTPRHIIELMVHMMDPQPTDEICDPACGSAGFLMTAAEYIRERHPEAMDDSAQRKHFHSSMFHGYDFDQTMLRIGSMNMLMHGVDRPDIRYRDSLSEAAGQDAEKYSLILANPPFAGSLDYETTSKDLLRVVKTKKTELLFLALSLRLLKPGGRAAVIVPDGVLFGSSKAHKDLRRTLVEEHALDAVVKLPAGAFKPYAGVSTAILIFRKTDTGGTENVWFYDIQADGWSLDDKRQPLLDADQLGAAPDGVFVVTNHDKNNLPDALDRWLQRESSERSRQRTEQSFCVSIGEIVDNDYDLSLNRYRQIGSETDLSREPHHEATSGNRTILRDYVYESLPKSKGEGFRVVGYKCLRDGRGIDLDATTDNRAGRVTPLKVGDIICRTIGDPRFTLVTASTTSKPLAADNSVHVLRFPDANPTIMLALLQSEYVQERINLRRYSGSGMARITYTNLLSIDLPDFPATSESIDSSPLNNLKSQVDGLVSEIQRRARQAFSTERGDAALRQYTDAVSEAEVVGRTIARMSSPLSLAQLTFPHPISRLVRTYELAKLGSDLRAENEAALHLFEACLICLAATLGGYQIASGRLLQRDWRSRLKRPGTISLGDWRKLAYASARDALSSDASLSGLAEASTEGAVADALIQDFLDWRNRKSHGSGPRTRSDFLSDNSERRKKVEYLIEAIRPLTRMRWWATENIDWDPELEKFRITVHDLHGDHPDFPIQDIVRDSPVARGTIMVTNGEDEWSIDSLMRYLPCPHCGEDEFFYPDSRVDDEFYYRSLARGHILTFELKDLPPDLRRAIKRNSDDSS